VRTLTVIPLLVFTLVACGSPVASSDTDKSAQELADESLALIRGAQTYRATGDVVVGDDRLDLLDLWLDLLDLCLRAGPTMRGTLSLRGERVELIVTEGKTYRAGGAGYWKMLGPAPRAPGARATRQTPSWPTNSSPGPWIPKIPSSH
jgi:hypothetical protein